MACLHDKMHVLKGHGFSHMIGKHIRNCRVLSFIFLKINFLKLLKIQQAIPSRSPGKLLQTFSSLCVFPRRPTLPATAPTPNLLRIYLRDHLLCPLVIVSHPPTQKKTIQPLIKLARRLGRAALRAIPCFLFPQTQAPALQQNISCCLPTTQSLSFMNPRDHLFLTSLPKKFLASQLPKQAGISC